MRDWRGSDGEPGEAAVKRGAQTEVGDDDATVGAIRLLEGGNLLGELQGSGVGVISRRTTVPKYVFELWDWIHMNRFREPALCALILINIVVSPIPGLA